MSTELHESRIEVTWQARTEPLAPCAVVAFAEAASELARRLLQRESLDGLSGVAGTDVLVVIAAEADLPWADGVVYLGAESAASTLLMPTTLAPSVPVALLERAIRMRLPNGAIHAIVPGHGMVIPLDRARPIAATQLHAWLATHTAGKSGDTVPNVGDRTA